MIHDARYLQAEFVPAEVVHRDAEVNHLSSVLEPLIRDDPAETALITGPTGAGKTCIAKFTVDQLQQETLDLDSQYVNCWDDHSRFQVLYRILDGVQSTVDVHRQSTPRDLLFERLREHDGSPYVVILDEVDQIEDKKLLYKLNRLPTLSLILIANSQEELLANVDDRLTSRLRGSEHIRFHRYTTDELVDILSERADRALSRNAIQRAELEEIADAASGDARVAITALRAAARKADQSNADRITSDLVERALPEARREIRQKNLDSLTNDQRVVYDVIEEYGEISPGDLYHEYRTRVEDPKSDRTVRNYLKKMKRYNLVEAQGATQDRVYRCVNSQESS